MLYLNSLSFSAVFQSQGLEIRSDAEAYSQHNRWS